MNHGRALYGTYSESQRLNRQGESLAATGDLGEDPRGAGIIDALTMIVKNGWIGLAP